MCVIKGSPHVMTLWYVNAIYPQYWNFVWKIYRLPMDPPRSFVISLNKLLNNWFRCQWFETSMWHTWESLRVMGAFIPVALRMRNKSTFLFSRGLCITLWKCDMGRLYCFYQCVICGCHIFVCENISVSGSKVDGNHKIPKVTFCIK